MFSSLWAFESFLDLAISLSFILIGIGLLFAMIRFVKGPGILDRIIALDLGAGLAIGYSILLALQYDQAAYLNIALCLAVIAFLASVALALYLEKAKGDD